MLPYLATIVVVVRASSAARGGPKAAGQPYESQ